MYQTTPLKITKSRLFILLAMTLAIATSAYLSISHLNQKAKAITPPDSCFAFDSATGTITNYYNHENNDSSQPACPKDVDIPSTIGGVAVTAIGHAANHWDPPSAATSFANKFLTSVTIPNSVTTIGDRAFSFNQLTTLTIPNAVTTIGNYAFAMNQITTLQLGNSVTTIGDGAFLSNQLTTLELGGSVTTIGDGAFAYNKLQTVHIEGNPSFDQEVFLAQGAIIDAGGESANIDSVITTLIYAPNLTPLPENELLRESDGDSDINNDGDQDDIFSVTIYNPTPLTIRYQDEQGNQLRPNQTLYGEGITDQLASTLDTNHPNATSADLANIYFFAGSQTTQTPPKIDGYIAPPSVDHTFTSGENIITMTYRRQVTTIDFADPANSAVVPANLDKLISQSVMSLDTTKECNAIQSAQLLPSDSFTAPNNDTVPQRTLGGLNFTLGCTTSGGTATVSLKLNGMVSDMSKLRVYKQHAITKKVTEITAHVKLTKTSDNKLVLSYNLTDGQIHDDDGEVNSQIVDPIYVTLEDSAKGLANTGMDHTLIMATALGVLSIGTLVTRRLLKR